MKIIKGEDLKGMEFIRQEDGTLKVYKRREKYIPNIGDSFWLLDNDGDCTFWNKYDNEKWIIDHNLVFRTEEECEDYKYFLETLDKYKYDFSDEEWKGINTQKYCLYYDCKDDKIYNDYIYFHKRESTYFKCQDDIESFINEVGEDRIKKYMFDVWE